MPMDAMAVNRRLSGVFLPLLRDLAHNTLCRIARPARTVSRDATESSLKHMQTGDQRWLRQSGRSGKCRTVLNYFVSWPLWQLLLSAGQKAKRALVWTPSQPISNPVWGAA
jgi:hypothetical protein